VPTPEERVEGILDEYPDRALRPVSTTHGRKLRAEAFDEAETVDREVLVGEYDTKTVSDVVDRPALPWIALVDEFLQDYEGYRDRALRMARGHDRHGDYECFEVPLENSFSPEYQSRQYARLKALKRMFLGESADQSPTGEEYPGVFDVPVTVLFGLTASSTPNGEYAPVVDHDREIRNAWSGSDGVRRTLRYVLQDKLGLESTDYAWWWQSEPHPGDGAAAGYSHSHPVVILDAAAVSTAADPGDPEAYRPVVAKHVAECEAAEWDAHRIREGSEKSAVKVREGDEITDFAGYVSEYLQVDPEKDLLERSDEYLMWAAAQWASTTQKYSKSRTATAGIRADRCHQEYVDDDAEQGHDHGERVVRSDRRGVEYECAACGSEFAIDQSPETLVEARRAAADGGTVTEPAETAADAPTATPTVRFDHDPVLLPRPDTADSDPAHGDERRTLRERWPSARRAGAIGAPTTERECDHTEPNTCPLCCEPGERVDASTPIPTDATPAAATVEKRESVDRPPSWRPEAIVQQQTGEETVIGSPGGVDYAELVEEGADAIPPEKLIDPDKLRTPEPEVDPTEYPPPELIDRQLAEIHHGDPITAKEWSGDWHAERYGESDEAAADGPLPWSDIQQYRSDNPAATVSELVEEFGVPESARSLVGGVVGPPG